MGTFVDGHFVYWDYIYSSKNGKIDNEKLSSLVGRWKKWNINVKYVENRTESS